MQISGDDVNGKDLPPFPAAKGRGSNNVVVAFIELVAMMPMDPPTRMGGLMRFGQALHTEAHHGLAAMGGGNYKATLKTIADESSLGSARAKSKIITQLTKKAT